MRVRRLLCVGLLLASCTTDRDAVSETGILVVVRSDLRGGRDLTRLHVETHRHDGETRVRSLRLGAAGDEGVDATLPLSFAVYASGKDLEHGVELRISGYGPEGLDPRVRRIGQLHFVRGELRRLVVDLARACEERFVECERSGKTCGGDGACIARAIDPSELAPVMAGEEREALPLFPKPVARPAPPPAPRDPQPDPAVKPAPVVDGPGQPTDPRGMMTTPRPMRDAGAVDMSMPDPPDIDARMPDTAVQVEVDAGVDAGPDAGPDAERSMPACQTTPGGARRCHAGVLYACRSGELVDPEPCTHGCAEASEQCYECQGDEHRCRDGQMYRCEAGELVEPEPCEHGCYEGANQCNQCQGSAVRCRADALEACEAGFYVKQRACPLGCSSLAPECLECLGPAGECGADGTIRLCTHEGRWWNAQCFGDCRAGDWTTDDDAGLPAAASWASCEGCASDDRRCTGRDILACGIDGYASPLGCHFGCDGVTSCREDTRVGQALLNTLL